MYPTTRRRVGVFGWGVVAPRSPNVEAFARNLESSESWLSPMEGFGPNNFLVGEPEFDFAEYRDWIDARFPPSRFSQLKSKMGQPTLYALGCFVQSLQQNPGLEQLLRDLGTQAHVYVGTGLGDLPTIHDISLDLYRAQRRWNRFWADPRRNRALTTWLDGGEEERSREADVPEDPRVVDDADRDAAEDAWWEYWSRRSPELQTFLAELREIEGMSVVGNVESGKAGVLRRKAARIAELKKRWHAPEPPWDSVSANLIWNISNTPASQISMIGGIRGMTFAPVAACSTFGYALHLGLNALRRGDARAVVVGATDASPHPLLVGSFYRARVLASDGRVSKPLTGLRGTHAAGGAAVWILGDLEYMRSKGLRPLGMEPLAVGVTADADHIITPSVEGPLESIRQALAAAEVEAGEIAHWDLHATATPGDFLEVQNARALLPETVLMTARKGTFGHGMAASGGWELTAQYLAYQSGRIAPTPLGEGELNEEIARIHGQFVDRNGADLPEGLAGKLSMGVGGVNACVISRPWDEE